MRKLEFRTLEIKSVSEPVSGEMYIEGYGAVFNNIDSDEDIIEKGAFAKTLKDNKGRIAFCYQHSIYTPIGKIEEIAEDNYGLKLKVRISDSEEEIKQKIREGILKEMSVGFQTIISSYDENTDIRTIKEVKLWEVSLVTIAANQLAVITGVKSLVDKTNTVNDLVENLLQNSTDKNTKFELLKLKSLLSFEPEIPLEEKQEPKPKTEVIDFSKISFK